MLTTGELITAAVSGGIGVKAIEWIYEEYKRRSTETRSAQKIVDQHLDPILKSADELVGKIRSLAKTDFRELPREPGSERDFSDVEFASLLYLFSQFWARLQILSQESVYVVLSSVTNGARLQEFQRTLETRRLRLVSRASQRGIGEALIIEGEQRRVMSFYEFFERYQGDQQLQHWLQPLARMLSETRHTAIRQRVLSYGAVLHALLDTLDPEHWVTKRRPGWGNKLSNRSRKELEYRIFRVYLPFVEHPFEYSRPCQTN